MLDTLFIVGPLQHTLDEDPRCLNGVGLDGARFDQLFDFCDGDPPRGRHHRIEIPRRPAIHQIALDKAKCEAAFLVSSKPVRIELDPEVNLLFEGKLEN